MKSFFNKKKLLTLFVGPLLATSPILAEDVKEVKQVEVAKTQEQIDEVSELIAKRLELAGKIATYKWNNKVAIDEPQKEEIFLNEIEQKAEQKGVDPKLARAFFLSQIEATKAACIQNFEKMGSRRRSQARREH